jgi:hypothetical protein
MAFHVFGRSLGVEGTSFVVLVLNSLFRFGLAVSSFLFLGARSSAKLGCFAPASWFGLAVSSRYRC